MLDYSLTTPEERNAYLHNLTDLDDYKPNELELCANYLLHAADKSLANHKANNKSSNSKNLELVDNGEGEAVIKPRKGSNAILRPNVPVPWEHPNLVDLKKDIEILLADEEAETDLYRKYKLHRWITELRMDAKARVPDYTIEVNPSWCKIEPIDLEIAGLDWTNSFHVKHLIRHYSELKQSETSKFLMEYFDSIIEQTPLLGWERHILIRYIDGTDTIIIAREVMETYDKVLYPGFVSKLMRQIYREIANEAEKLDIERSVNKKLWRRCPRCGKKHPDHAYWWRIGQRACKECFTGIPDVELLNEYK